LRWGEFGSYRKDSGEHDQRDDHEDAELRRSNVAEIHSYLDLSLGHLGDAHNIGLEVWKLKNYPRKRWRLARGLASNSVLVSQRQSQTLQVVTLVVSAYHKLNDEPSLGLISVARPGYYPPKYRGSSAPNTQQAHSSNSISAVERAVLTLKLEREARRKVSGIEDTTPDVP
jgi:hypothetical protein